MALVLLASTAIAQTLPTQAALAAYLAPNTDATTTILGETLDLYPFDLSILTNETHALLAFNVSKPSYQIGYLSVGFGSSMADSSMVVLWPDETGLSWTLSPRSSSGHSTPQIDPSVNDSADGAFAIVPAFTVLTSTGTSVAFVRALELPKNQTLFSSTEYLNMSRTATKQRITYAFTKSRPSSMAVDAGISQHDYGNFGSTSVDLTKNFVGSVVGSWGKYDTVVVIHAAVGLEVWVILSPGAILIGRLGRAWGAWFTWHSWIQGVFVVPATCAVVALGILANHWGFSDSLTGHKLFGFIVLVLSFAQVGLGYTAHSKFTADRTSRPWYNAVHIVLGVLTLLLAWVQIALGFLDYSDRPISVCVFAVIAVLAVLFLVSYLGSLGVLVKRRRAEGRMWSASVFGLGRDAASVNASGLRGAPSAWNGSGGLPEMDEEATPGGSEVKLMAWNR